jgi:acylphosphatase
MTRHCRVVVHGTVQGVGFRYSAREAARDAGVGGWVRNRRDGTVEAELHGPDAAVDRMLAWLAEGPATAAVARIEVTDAPAASAPGFDLLPTA